MKKRYLPRVNLFIIISMYLAKNVRRKTTMVGKVDHIGIAVSNLIETKKNKKNRRQLNGGG